MIKVIENLESNKKKQKIIECVNDMESVCQLIKNYIPLIFDEEEIDDIETIEINEETYNKVKNGCIIPKNFKNSYAALKYKNKIIALYKEYDKDPNLSKPFKMFLGDSNE